MKYKQKSILVILVIFMVTTILLLDKMGLNKAIEACEAHNGVVEVKEGLFSWKVSCHNR